MEPFNIRLDKGGETHTMTVQPAEDHYKIIYFGAIIEVITLKGEKWIRFDGYEPVEGDVPMVSYKLAEGEEVPKMDLTSQDLQQIGEAIREEVPG